MGLNTAATYFGCTHSLRIYKAVDFSEKEIQVHHDLAISPKIKPMFTFMWALLDIVTTALLDLKPF